MKELLRSNNPVLISWLSALLVQNGIPAHLFDEHASVMEGSIGALPRRLMVGAEDYERACRLLTEEVEANPEALADAQWCALWKKP